MFDAQDLSFRMKGTRPDKKKRHLKGSALLMCRSPYKYHLERSQFFYLYPIGSL